LDAYFVVIDSAGQKLACIWFEEEPGRRRPEGMERYFQPPSEDILDGISLAYIAGPFSPSLESATE